MNSVIPVGNVPVTMSSREVAVLTGKQHSNVMRDIRVMIDQLKADSNLNWHCETETYLDEQGKPREQYRMDKDTTLTLVSGYDAVLRCRIINRWQELEAQPAQSFDIATMSAAALRELATKIEECAKLNAQVVTMTPKADYYDRLIGMQETIDLEAAAKSLRTSRPKLIEFLKDRAILTKRGLPSQVYIDRDFLRVALTPYEDMFGRERISEKTVVTQPGLLYIRGLIDTLERSKSLAKIG